MTEAEFQEAVIGTAHTFGWKVAHFRAARTKHGWRTPVAADGQGWPDLVLVGPGGILHRELKGDGGKVSDEQAEWGEWITAAGGDWKVWWPADMPEVVATLSMGRGQLGGRRA